MTRGRYLLPTNIAHYRFGIRIVLTLDFGVQAHRLVFVDVGGANCQGEGEACDILLLVHEVASMLTIMMTYRTLV